MGAAGLVFGKGLIVLMALMLFGKRLQRRRSHPFEQGERRRSGDGEEGRDGVDSRVDSNPSPGTRGRFWNTIRRSWSRWARRSSRRQLPHRPHLWWARVARRRCVSRRSDRGRSISSWRTAGPWKRASNPRRPSPSGDGVLNGLCFCHEGPRIFTKLIRKESSCPFVKFVTDSS